MLDEPKRPRLHFSRSSVDYHNLCDQFRLKEKPFKTQYYSFYVQRLKTMKPLVEKSVQSTWGSDVRIVNMTDLIDRADEKVVIIGILFKNMANQPTILKEISMEDNQFIPQPARDCYIDDKDYLMLQDENECVKLFGSLPVHSNVTGIVIGLFGYASPEGDEFIVEDFCYPCLPVHHPYSSSSLNLDGHKYVLILSGLGFSRHPSSQLSSAFELLSNYLAGLVEPEKSSKIVRLIIAGNLIGSNVKKDEEANDSTKNKPWLRKVKPYSVDIMAKVDDFLAELGKSIEIDIMPGSTDITSQLLPQQSLHPCILPKSSICSAIRSVTNPYSASFDSRLFIGSSGQPVDNIRKFSDLSDPIEIMEKTLVWSHLAPTAPDTLHSYPASSSDPFIMTTLPDIYFTGNQEKFATKMKKFNSDQDSVRFISIPCFESTFSGALINLANLTCDMVTFT